MGEKVAALPSLSLPKQKTHWSVFLVIASGATFLILSAAWYTVMNQRNKAEMAYTQQQEAKTNLIKAEADKARAEKERTEAEIKKKEAEAAAAAAQAAAQKKAAQTAVTEEDQKKKKKSGKGSSKTVASKGSTPALAPTAGGTPAAPEPPKPKPTSSKASKDIDDLLKSFR
jgi:hypothetical protein